MDNGLYLNDVVKHLQLVCNIKYLGIIKAIILQHFHTF